MFDDYMDYLLDYVSASVDPDDYYLSLKKMMDTEFYWTIDLDENRATDGEWLRNFYERDTGEECPITGPCRFLEMLIALCIHINNSLVDDNDWDVGTWFWSIIDNLEIYPDRYMSEQSLDYKIRMCLDRTYDRQGVGGMFPLNTCADDVRKIPIWTQAYKWISENFPVDLLYN